MKEFVPVPARDVTAGQRISFYTRTGRFIDGTVFGSRLGKTGLVFVLKQGDFVLDPDHRVCVERSC